MCVEGIEARARSGSISFEGDGMLYTNLNGLRHR